MGKNFLDFYDLSLATRAAANVVGAVAQTSMTSNDAANTKVDLAQLDAKLPKQDVGTNPYESEQIEAALPKDANGNFLRADGSPMSSAELDHLKLLVNSPAERANLEQQVATERERSASAPAVNRSITDIGDSVGGAISEQRRIDQDRNATSRIVPNMHQRLSRAG